MPIRPATKQELAPYLKEGYETVGFILEPDPPSAINNLSGSRRRELERSGIGKQSTINNSVPDLSPFTSHLSRPRSGQIFLSRAFGQVFGHNTWCKSEDPRDAARLWLAARRQARAWGAKEVWIHFDGTEPEELVQFWTRLGFRPAMVMYRGEIGSRL